MAGRLVVTLRFHAEGAEAELYRNIQAGKEKSALSASEYVKKILADYFADGQKRKEAEQVLQEIREEYREMIGRVERTIRGSIQEHDALLIGALGKVNGMEALTESSSGGEPEHAGLLEEGGDIPEGTLDFLESL